MQSYTTPGLVLEANGRTVVTSHPDGTITCTLADPGFHPAQYSRSRSRSPAATPQPTPARNLTTPTPHNPGADPHSSQARSVMGSEGSGGEGVPRQAQTGLGSRGVVQLRSVGLASRGMAAPMQSSDAWACMENMELESPKCEVKGESHIRDLKRKAAEVTLGLGAAALLLGYTTGAACAMKHVADGAATGQWQPLPVLAREITYSVASTTAATFAGAVAGPLLGVALMGRLLLRPALMLSSLHLSSQWVRRRMLGADGLVARLRSGEMEAQLEALSAIVAKAAANPAFRARFTKLAGVEHLLQLLITCLAQLNSEPAAAAAAAGLPPGFLPFNASCPTLNLSADNSAGKLASPDPVAGPATPASQQQQQQQQQQQERHQQSEGILAAPEELIMPTALICRALRALAQDSTAMDSMVQWGAVPLLLQTAHVAVVPSNCGHSSLTGMLGAGVPPANTLLLAAAAASLHRLASTHDTARQQLTRSPVAAQVLVNALSVGSSPAGIMWSWPATSGQIKSHLTALMEMVGEEPAGKTAVAAAGGLHLLCEQLARAAPGTEEVRAAASALHALVRGDPHNQLTLSSWGPCGLTVALECLLSGCTGPSPSPFSPPQAQGQGLQAEEGEGRRRAQEDLQALLMVVARNLDAAALAEHLPAPPPRLLAALHPGPAQRTLPPANQLAAPAAAPPPAASPSPTHISEGVSGSPTALATARSAGSGGNAATGPSSRRGGAAPTAAAAAVPLASPLPQAKGSASDPPPTAAQSAVEPGGAKQAVQSKAEEGRAGGKEEEGKEGEEGEVIADEDGWVAA